MAGSSAFRTFPPQPDKPPRTATQFLTTGQLPNYASGKLVVNPFVFNETCLEAMVPMRKEVGADGNCYRREPNRCGCMRGRTTSSLHQLGYFGIPAGSPEGLPSDLCNLPTNRRISAKDSIDFGICWVSNTCQDSPERMAYHEAAFYFAIAAGTVSDVGGCSGRGSSCL
jgi:hypothetical protein